MNLARVIGSVWATRSHPGTEGLKMQLIQPVTGEGKPTGGPLAAFDAAPGAPVDVGFEGVDGVKIAPACVAPIVPGPSIRRGLACRQCSVGWGRDGTMGCAPAGH